MPYIMRDNTKQIVGVFERPQYEEQEFSEETQEVKDFKTKNNRKPKDFPVLQEQLNVLWKELVFESGSDGEKMQKCIIELIGKQDVSLPLTEVTSDVSI